jgi:hypothetical protein
MIKLKLEEEESYAKSLLTSIVTDLKLIINYSNKLNIDLDADFVYDSNLANLITREIVSSFLDNSDESNELISTILTRNVLCTEFKLIVEQRKSDLETRHNSELARLEGCVARIKSYQSDLSQFHGNETEYLSLDFDETDISKYDEYYKLCQSLQIELQNKTRDIIDNLTLELKKLHKMCFLKQDEFERFMNALVTNQNECILDYGSGDHERHLQIGFYTLSTMKILEMEILRLKNQYSLCKQIYTTINQRATILQVI